MDERDGKPERDETVPPPGDGDSIEDASRDAVEEIATTGNAHAGAGDAG